MHNVFYDFLKPLAGDLQPSLFGETTPDTELFNISRLENILASHWVNDGYESTEQRDDYHRRAKQALLDFLGAFLSNYEQAPRPMFLEKSFSFKIGGETIKGAIDRVDKLDGGVEVIDYKTGRPKDKLVWKDRRQLILYQLFLEEVLQIKVLSLRYYYVEGGASLSFVPKESEKEKLKLEIIAQIKEIKARHFLPRPSEMCKFCDFNKICEFRQR
jgi:CRISPR-associated protein Cas4